MTCAKILVTLITVTTGILSGAVNGQGICTGMTPCYCKFDNGQFLDISALGRLDGIPRFDNVTDRAENTYSWNPCFNFTEGGCHEVALCGIRPAFPHDIDFALGYQNTTRFSIDSNNAVKITYSTEGDGKTPIRKAHVTLKCVKEDLNNMTLLAIGRKHQRDTDYYFELHSVLACPQGTPNNPTTIPNTAGTTPHTSMSTSEILLICAGIVIVLLLIALLLAFLKIKRKICVTVEYDNL